MSWSDSVAAGLLTSLLLVIVVVLAGFFVWIALQWWPLWLLYAIFISLWLGLTAFYRRFGDG